MVFLFIGFFAIVLSQIVPPLFGFWSGTFMIAYSIFILVYCKSQITAMSIGFIVLLLYETVSGQIVGELVLPFLATCLLFYLTNHFFQIYSYDRIWTSISGLMHFFFVTIFGYIIFSLSSFVWYIFNGYTSNSQQFWIIREPQHTLYVFGLTLLIYLLSTRIISKLHVQSET